MMALPSSNSCTIEPLNKWITLSSDISRMDSDKVKLLKLDIGSSNGLKRRRSQSQNGQESLTYFNGENNLIIASKDDSLMDSSILSNSLPNDSSITHNQWGKTKTKKETHNRVERKRRDFINAQIQKLSKLLPQEYFINNDLKMNKGLTLKNSVEYISSLKFVDTFNQHLLKETEYAARVIKLLLKSNEVKCPQLYTTEEIPPHEFQHIFNDWLTLHQESQKMMLHISNTIMQCKETNHVENRADSRDSKGTDEKSYINERKRYSSVPSNLDPEVVIDMKSNDVPEAAPTSATTSTVDFNTPLLDTLLRSKLLSSSSVEDTIRSFYRSDPGSSQETVPFTNVRYVGDTGNSTHSHQQDLNTDNAIVMNLANFEMGNSGEKILHNKDKTYFILPRFHGEDASPVVQALPPHQQQQHQYQLMSLHHDPMLLAATANSSNNSTSSTSSSSMSSASFNHVRLGLLLDAASSAVMSSTPSTTVTTQGACISINDDASFTHFQETTTNCRR